MALCQNESETTEAIKEVKALCASTIREAKAHQVTLISEAEAQHATCIRELNPTAPPPLQRQRTAALWLSGRQSPMVPNRPAPSNCHMPRACNVWRWKP